MIRIENTEVMGWEAAIRGMRNPKNSWEKSDSGYCLNTLACHSCKWNRKTEVNCKKNIEKHTFVVGKDDLDLMRRLASGGPVHAKYRRMITVYVDITAPLYWWKEFDTYRVGVEKNSCSTMHKLPDKEFTLEDFSCEHLIHAARIDLGHTIDALNFFRNVYLHGGMVKNEDGEVCGYGKGAKQIWWNMIQLLPSSYNQKRTVMLNYEVLSHIWNDRRSHKLDEWCEHETPAEHKERNKNFASGAWGFCDWIKTLPYSELITGENENAGKCEN